jgi:chaperonin GroEL
MPPTPRRHSRTNKDSGLRLESTTGERLGRAHKVIVTEGETTILGGAGDAEDVNAQIAQIRAELDRVENERDREHLAERLATLAGQVALIRRDAVRGSDRCCKGHALGATEGMPRPSSPAGSPAS